MLAEKLVKHFTGREGEVDAVRGVMGIDVASDPNAVRRRIGVVLQCSTCG